MINKLITAREARERSEAAPNDVNVQISRVMVSIEAAIVSGALCTRYEVPTTQLSATVESSLAAKLKGLGYRTSSDKNGATTSMLIEW